MRCRLVLAVACLLFASSAFAEGKPTPKIDTKNVAGTVKWLCQNFETGFTETKLKKCSEKDSASDNAYHQCLEVLNSGLGQKRLTFSGVAAQNCIKAQKSYVMDPGKARRQAMHAVCAPAVVGLKVKGDACESPLDCRPTLACIGVKGSSAGKCTKPLAAGENCDTDLLGGSAYIRLLQQNRGVCGAGLVCSEDTGKPRVCVEQGKVNDPTFQQNAGGACTDSGQCKGVCASGKCKAVCGSG